MRRYLRYSPAVSLLIIPLFFIFTATPWPWKLVPGISLVVLAIIAAWLSYLPRKCGHGLVSQTRLPILFWPYALRTCPHCEAKEW